jgi:hypothetical protein
MPAAARQEEGTMKCYYCLIAGLILCFSSCTNNSSSPLVSDIFHAPVTANVTNGFTFTVDATQYSDNSNNDLNFLSDSLVVTLSSTSYVSGRAIIVVSDAANVIIFSDTIRSNKTVGIAHLKTTKPRHCTLNITDLTAKLAFAIVGQ